GISSRSNFHNRVVRFETKSAHAAACAVPRPDRENPNSWGDAPGYINARLRRFCSKFLFLIADRR
ncbi:MAG: hypothetical protein L6R28_24420, partial [Planctomycetes bacterium]|nr:hypothetical protein [Planctomycetota bacterium]